MRRAFLLLLFFFAGCSSSEDASNGNSTTTGADAGDGGTTTNTDGGTGEPSCITPAPTPTFAVASAITTRDAWVVVTGTAPIGFKSVTVGGAKRGVHEDPARGVWSYVLQHQGGSKVTLDVAVDGATKKVAVDVTDGPALPARDLTAGKHTVGAWMFPWFDGDSGWDCVSPWRPAGGFATWDGTIGWARKQILDQMDAHLDVVGLQYSEVSGGSWPRVLNIFKALRELVDEGYAPPRFFPLFDTIIWGETRFEATGSAVDLASTTGRADFYTNIGTFYSSFATELGTRDATFANARMDGKPFVSMWHSATNRFTGVSTGSGDAALNTSFFTDLKTRFVAQHNATPWIVAHPNNWRHGTGADEITLMFGPPTHFFTETYGARTPTVNIEPGFWNPTTNAFYLARNGGTNYAAAWTSALGVRATADHLYIDSWNETGEGSGIFDAPPLTYTSSTDGPCQAKPWTYKHDDSWGATSRHYIDETRKNADQWNDVPARGAELVADDLPDALKAGERRWVSIVVRNAGDDTWTDDVTITGPTGSKDFGVKDVPMMPDTPRKRGFPAVFTFEIVAPCEAGNHRVELVLADNKGSLGASVLTRTIAVTK